MAFDYSVPSIDNPPTFPVPHEVRSPLDRAIGQWEAGNRIPLDLAVELMEEGYDLPTLKAQHLGGLQ
ncbi:hypothetical protein [Variovorax sp. PMC12]|uniref:hypothetical protein n=1 Tax=Variovorax sp. PMC12 TaxID=2126319 RepID=UPI000D1302E1|nr:hypothetical protein [Variovorax sp. PMC12]AVQ80731.1 hypothetical protein C4F17_07085 [Variovorax sp. PMC12]